MNPGRFCRDVFAKGDPGTAAVMTFVYWMLTNRCEDRLARLLAYDYGLARLARALKALGVEIPLGISGADFDQLYRGIDSPIYDFPQEPARPVGSYESDKAEEKGGKSHG